MFDLMAALACTELFPLWGSQPMPLSTNSIKQNDAPEPVRLELGQTADPGKCGSCKFFARTNSDSQYRDTVYAEKSGFCVIVLPPWVAGKGQLDAISNPEGGRDWLRVNDAAGCDLHRHTGCTYIVSQLVKP